MKKIFKSTILVVLTIILVCTAVISVAAYKTTSGYAGTISVSAYLNVLSGSVFASTEASSPPYAISVSVQYFDTYDQGSSDGTSYQNYNAAGQIDQRRYTNAEFYRSQGSLPYGGAYSSHYATDIIYDASTGTYRSDYNTAFSRSLSEILP